MSCTDRFVLKAELKSCLHRNQMPISPTDRKAASLGAWVSPQSEVIGNREVLDKKMVELEKEQTGKEIKRPLHWGGYKVIPVTIEFWQGRTSRLHDRLLFTRINDSWKLERLAP
jgi:pyridoxamine 5'-phosphate oxidase